MGNPLEKSQKGVEMAYSFKGGLNFGFVYIPIELHASIKEHNIGFNMIDKNTMSRIKYVKTCVDCDDKPVKNEDIVKGYEYEKDKYVIFDDKDFDKLKSKKDENINILQFVKIDEIDPVYYDKPYYVVPKGANKAFDLFAKALEKQGKVGIAKSVIGTKEVLLALRVKDGKMFVNTLHYYDEVQPCPKVESNEKIDAQELKMATAIIDGMTKPLKMTEFVDEYQQRVQDAIVAKINGKQIVAPKAKEEKSVANLMDALTKSLQALEKDKQKIINKSPRKKTQKVGGIEK